ncbi:hypothetical protein BHM03_00010982 [Ensete ventricosum]|nr:hypothetical protein BHM03_00010982 [Ensete ventricosum]
MAMPISSSSVARIATKPFDGLVRSASRSCSIGKIHSDRRTRHPSIRSALITEPDAFEVGKFVGSYGFMNITRSVPPIICRVSAFTSSSSSSPFASPRRRSPSSSSLLKKLRKSLNSTSRTPLCPSLRISPYLSRQTQPQQPSTALAATYSSLGAAQSTLSEGLWRRASGAGAFTPLEKRAYGIADDM